MADTSQEDSIDSIFERAITDSNVQVPNDVLVLALHASLLSERFECISVKEEDLSSEQANDVIIATPTSPTLPEGWNSSPDSTDNIDSVITVTLSTATYIKQQKEGEKIDASCLKNIIKLFSILNKEVVEKIKRIEPKKSSKAKKESDVKHKTDLHQTPSHRNDSSSSDDEPNPRFIQRPDPVPMIDPLRVGAGDLSPFGGGGMLMDPLRDGRFGGPGLGGGPHPPGARYDPVSPFQPPGFHPGVGQYGRGRGRGRGGSLYGPDPDHLPPPGYDDMFM